MKKVRNKISNLYFISAFIAAILMLLPQDNLYFGYSWTITGFILLILVFILIPIIFIISIFHDLKSKNWKLFWLRIIVLFFGFFIWYLQKYVLHY